MPNPATYTDLENRWRPLSGSERTVGATLLDDAWRMLRRRMTPLGVDLEESITTDDDVVGEAIRVMCSAVTRVMKNPDGNKREAVDDWSAERNSDVYSGELYFTSDEIAAVVPDGDGKAAAFSFSFLRNDYPDDAVTTA